MFSGLTDVQYNKMVSKCSKMSDKRMIIEIICYSYENPLFVCSGDRFDDFINSLEWSFWNSIFKRNVEDVMVSNKHFVISVLDKNMELNAKFKYTRL